MRRMDENLQRYIKNSNREARRFVARDDERCESSRYGRSLVYHDELTRFIRNHNEQVNKIAMAARQSQT